MDERENPYVLKDKYQLFSLSKQMVKSLIELAQEKEVLVEESVCLYSRPVYRFRCNPAHLESEVFRHAQEKYQKKRIVSACIWRIIRQMKLCVRLRGFAFLCGRRAIGIEILP